MKIFPCHFINLDQRSFIRLQKAGEDEKWSPSEELSHSYCPTAQLVLFPSFLPFSHSCCISCWPDWKKWRKVSNFADFDWKLVVNSIWQAHQENQKVSMDKCQSDFISLVKICVFIQWLELILKRSDPTEKETSVIESKTRFFPNVCFWFLIMVIHMRIVTLGWFNKAIVIYLVDWLLFSLVFPWLHLMSVNLQSLTGEMHSIILLVSNWFGQGPNESLSSTRRLGARRVSHGFEAQLLAKLPH